MLWDQPIAQQSTLKMATSRIPNISNWLAKNRNVKVGAAIALPCLAILLSTTPVSSTIARFWRRMTSKISHKKKPSTNKRHTIEPEPEHHEHADYCQPKSPRKTFSFARTPTYELQEPDSLSLNSDSSSEKTIKQARLRLGKGIKKAWQNRPFNHAHDSPVSPMSHE